MKGLLIIIIVFGVTGFFSIVLPEMRRGLHALRRRKHKGRARMRQRIVLASEPGEPVVKAPETSECERKEEHHHHHRHHHHSDGGALRPKPVKPPLVRVSRQPARDPVTDPVERLPASVIAEIVGDKREGAARLWEEARKMKHAVVPDPKTDEKYLKTLAVAARLGHVGAMKELGTCANKRDKVVEANFWLTLAELSGAADVEQAVRAVRAHWVAKNCPREYDNVHDDFTKDDGTFSRAVLHLRSGKAFRHACERLTELSGKGHREAKLYMEKHGIRPMAPARTGNFRQSAQTQ